MTRQDLTWIEPILLAVLLDVRSYFKARQDAKEAGQEVPPWDWSVFAERLAYGVATAAITLMTVGGLSV